MTNGSNNTKNGTPNPRDTFHIWSIIFSQKLKRLLEIQENYSSKHMEREEEGDDGRCSFNVDLIQPVKGKPLE